MIIMIVVVKYGFSKAYSHSIINDLKVMMVSYGLE